jgi:hypothetical protein
LVLFLLKKEGGRQRTGRGVRLRKGVRKCKKDRKRTNAGYVTNLYNRKMKKKTDGEEGVKP